MKMKKIYKWLMAALLVNATALNAQEASTLYFIEKNPMRHQLNPAYQPEGKFFIGMPGLSSLNFNVGNNCLTFSDVFQGQTVNGEKQTVSFLSKYADNGIDNFLDALNENVRVYTDYNVMLLSFGLRVKQKHYITFGLANRADVQVSIPKTLPKAILKGNTNPDGRLTMGIEDFSTVASLYTELAVGYSQQFNEKWNFGAKSKLLLGHANVHTDFKDMSLTMDKDEWKLTGDGSVDVALPGLVLTPTEDGTLDEVEFSDDVAAGDFVKPSGVGMAFDLGATYQLLPNLNVSASVLDLGMIRWNKSLHHLTKKKDFVFNGVVYEVSDRDTIDYGKEYEDLANSMYTVDNNTKAYNAWLTAKVLLGAEYGVWNNKMTFGLLSKTYILQRKMYEEMTLSANFKPWRIFSAALSYSLLDGEWHNLGLATNFNFGPVNYYLALDQIPLLYATGGGAMIPTRTRGANFSMGLNYVFGYKPKKIKEPKDSKDVQPRQPEKASDSETAGQVADTIVVKPIDVPTQMGDTAVVDTVADVPTQKADTVPAVKDTVKVAPDEPNNTVKVDEYNFGSGDNEGELIEAAVYGIKFSSDGHLMILDKQCYPLLDSIAQRMKANPSLKIHIRGHYHLDNQGEEFSRFMSRERAHLVRNYLLEKDIEIDRITIDGAGSKFSIAPNNTNAGRKKNRRMELRYKGL